MINWNGLLHHKMNSSCETIKFNTEFKNMLVANILAILEQASLSKAVMTVQNVNGTPSLILSFIADRATVTDSHKVMGLRKTLAQPLVVTGQDLEEQLIEFLGHSADELISVITVLKKEQNKQPKQKAKTASGKGAAATKSPDSTATKTATSQETTQADQTPTAVEEPAQNAAQQVSQISMLNFSL